MHKRIQLRQNRTLVINFIVNNLLDSLKFTATRQRKISITCGKLASLRYMNGRHALVVLAVDVPQRTELIILTLVI